MTTNPSPDFDEEPELRRQLALAQAEAERWRTLALHLVECHGATATWLLNLKSAPKGELRRHRNILDTARRAIEGEPALGSYRERYRPQARLSDVSDHLAHMIRSIDERGQQR